MGAVEIVGADGHTPDPVRAASVSRYCHEQGVLTLTCGTFGNVLRFLPPLVMPDHLLAEAFDVVAEAFDATG
jgi:4-aminobutyrate aminotransferase/(S)-3-amino-2-methylpropionate transaminase